MGMGQNCPETPPISHYQGKMTRESMVRCAQAEPVAAGSRCAQRDAPAQSLVGEGGCVRPQAPAGWGGRTPRRGRDPRGPSRAGAGPTGLRGRGRRASHPTEPRSGADGPQWASVVSMGWSSVARRSPRAFGCAGRSRRCVEGCKSLTVKVEPTTLAPSHAWLSVTGDTKR